MRRKQPYPQGGTLLKTAGGLDLEQVMRNLLSSAENKRKACYQKHNGGLARLLCFGMGMLLACQAQAYLLEKDPDANAGDLWERIEKPEYQLRINMNGGAVLYLDDVNELPGMPELVLTGVPGKGNITLASDLGNGRGAWSKLRGQRRDAEDKTKVKIEGLFYGLHVVKDIVAEENSVRIDYLVQGATPIPGKCAPYFDRARFMRRPEGMRFSAETQAGEKTTGDLCQSFEKINDLKRLEVRAGRKLVSYDFGAISGVVLESSGMAPDHPNAAYISVLPQNVQLDQGGVVFGYRIIIKISSAS